jgi:hypothetical protein
MSERDMRSAADFSAARGRAFVNRVMAALSGHSRRLLAYEEVREKLRLGGPVYRGVQAVPLDKVIGSLDRYRDFDRFFAPLQSHTQDRWQKINRAWYEETNLPPVLLYKVGEVYFVVDGNHRVSVARSKGQVYIDAEVREAVTRVPLTSDVEPEDLQRLGERVDFLERTQLDRLRPGIEIETTILGGYDRLVEHIAVHRYFMGMDEGREISSKEAIEHWYDTLYRPVVEVVEDSGILESFPDRTAADLYLWVMDHLHFLKSRTDDATADAVSAAEDFIYGQRKDVP